MLVSLGLYCAWLIIISHSFDSEMIKNLLYYATKYISSSFFLSCLLLMFTITYIKNFELQPMLVFLKLNNPIYAVFSMVTCICLIYIISFKCKKFGLNLPIILCPIAEEIFFTGTLFQVLQQRFSIRRSALLNSICFALFHLPGWWIIQNWSITAMGDRLVSLFLFGLITCFAFHKCRSLWISILIHWLNNAIAFLYFHSVA